MQMGLHTRSLQCRDRQQQAQKTHSKQADSQCFEVACNPRQWWRVALGAAAAHLDLKAGHVALHGVQCNTCCFRFLLCKLQHVGIAVQHPSLDLALGKLHCMIGRPTPDSSTAAAARSPM